MAERGHEQRMPTVGIIGAGIAGLSAAHRLREAGIGVEVFDKGRGPGGRASTRRVEHADRTVTFDHGAQYFTARDERFERVVEQWVHDGVCAPWQGVIASVDSAGQVTPKPGNPARYVGTPGMSAIVAAKAREVPVRFSSVVDRVERSGDAWVLDGPEGALGRFDGLVLATPAPQAATLLERHPQMAARARECEMQPCWAVMAAFDSPLPIEADGVFINLDDNPLSWIARDSSKPDRPEGERWVLHAGPNWSETNIEHERDDIVLALSKAMGDALDIGVPKPVHAAAHRWRYALTTSSVDGGCLLDTDAGLAVAGDWCHGGRVEGAYLSGLAAAEGLLDRFG